MTIKRKDLFNSWANNYDEDLETPNDFPFDGYEKVLDTIVKEAQTEKGMTIFDLGSGTGNLSAKFYDLGCRVTGLDFSSAMIAEAKKKLPKVFFMQADLTKPFRLGAKVDCIVSAYVFHEFDLKTKYSIIEHSLSHLKANGKLIIGDISFASRNDRALAFERFKHVWDETEHYWAADETGESLNTSITMSYQQLSSCAGVFVFKKEQET